MKLLMRRLILKSGDEIIEDLSFKEGLTMVFSKNRELIADALKNLFVYRATRKKHDRRLELYAELESDKRYTARGFKKSGGCVWQIKIYDQNAGECTGEYYAGIKKSSEELSMHFPSGITKYSERIYRYKRSDEFYPDRELMRVTDDICATRFFRAYMSEYISRFFPRCIDREKQLYLIMTPEGKFKAACGAREYHPPLSPQENAVFQYYCRMQLAVFWMRFRYMIDFNSPVLPLCVSGLAEGLDGDMSVGRILTETEKMPLQTIFLAS